MVKINTISLGLCILLLCVIVILNRPESTIFIDTVGELPSPNQFRMTGLSVLYYNEFHQRSDRINEQASIRVLLLGDSVLHGGRKITQSKTIGFLLENKLQKKCECDVQVLSAALPGSNLNKQFNYIDTFGTFNATHFFWIVNEQDLAESYTVLSLFESMNEQFYNYTIVFVPSIYNTSYLEYSSNTIIDGRYFMQEFHYRDWIHLNVKGNHKISEMIYETFDFE